MEKSFKITLADGTQLKNLKLNGNNYISKTEITEDDFKGIIDLFEMQAYIYNDEKTM